MTPRKPQIVVQTGDPLFVILRAFKGMPGSKIENLCRNFYEERYFSAIKQYRYRWEIVEDVLSRIVRDRPMLIDDYNDVAARVMRRYQSTRNQELCGCLVVYYDERFRCPRPITIRDDQYNIVITWPERKASKDRNRKRPKDYQDVQCLLAELKFIESESRKRNLTWETKSPKLERLAMFAS